MASQLNPLNTGSAHPPGYDPAARINQHPVEPGSEGLSLGVMQHDEAILYQLTEVMKPRIVQNGQQIVVPVQISNREVWEQVRRQGYLRDPNEKLLVPIITISRTTIRKNRDKGTKLDANFPQVHRLLEQRWNPRNAYLNFQTSADRQPERRYVAVAVPDYITITYEGIIQTYYMPHMLQLTEMLLYASDSYWGKPGEYRFLTTLESVDAAAELNIGEERILTSRFSLKVEGYLLPEIPQRMLQSPKVISTPTNVTFTESFQ